MALLDNAEVPACWSHCVRAFRLLGRHSCPAPPPCASRLARRSALTAVRGRQLVSVPRGRAIVDEALAPPTAKAAQDHAMLLVVRPVLRRK
jgi:hypothetical protein